MANGIRVRVSKQRVSHFTEKYDASPATTAADEDLSVYVVAGQGGKFQHAGGQDDGCGEQE